MTKYLPWVLAGVVVVIVAALFLADQADSRADRAEGRVAVLDSIRQAADSKARQDSLMLASATQEYAADTARLAQEGSVARRRASEAVRVGQEAADALRATLDAQQAILLDSMEAAGRAKDLAYEAELAATVSEVATERNLRVATEEALATERAARQADAPLIGALREQIAALESRQRRGKVELWATRGAVVAAIIIL